MSQHTSITLQLLYQACRLALACGDISTVLHRNLWSVMREIEAACELPPVPRASRSSQSRESLLTK